MRFHEISEHLIEGRDAPIYHGTNWFAANRIVEDDQLAAKTFHVMKVNNTMNSMISGISFSRDLRLSMTFGPVVFVFDQAKIVRNHKLKPIDFWGFSRETQFGGRRQEQYAESEEFLLGPLVGMSRYLIEIRGNARQLNQEARAKGIITLGDAGKLVNGTVEDEPYKAIVHHPLMRWMDTWAGR